GLGGRAPAPGAQRRAALRDERPGRAVEHPPPARSGGHLRAARRRDRDRPGGATGARRPVPAVAARERARLRAHRGLRPAGDAVSTFTPKESSLDPQRAVLDEVVASGRGFTRDLRRGQIFRIVDLEGNQAVDTLFYNARNPEERYSSCDTIRAQGSIYLTTGTRLVSSEGRALLTIVADTCGRHDTLGGACSAESNQVRYALDKKHMHNCRDSFLLAMA